MRDCIEKFAQRPEHAVCDSCAVCILSHGVEGSIYGSDGQLLEVSPRFAFTLAFTKSETTIFKCLS